MSGERRPSLLTHFKRFVSAHRRCGAFVWDTEDGEDGFAIGVRARCLGCDASFLESATASEVASAVVHSRGLTSMN